MWAWQKLTLLAFANLGKKSSVLSELALVHTVLHKKIFFGIRNLGIPNPELLPLFLLQNLMSEHLCGAVWMKECWKVLDPTHSSLIIEMLISKYLTSLFFLLQIHINRIHTSKLWNNGNNHHVLHCRWFFLKFYLFAPETELSVLYKRLLKIGS